MKRILIGALTITASAALAAPASAAVTFQGYATGCFTTTTCSPSTTATPGTATTIGGLTYTASSVDVTTNHISFTQSINSAGQAFFGGTDLGSFSLNNTIFDYNPYFFDFLVTFTAPPGTQAGSFTADLIGSVQAEQNGGVRINFFNDANNPLTLTSSAGTFTFYIDDLSIGQSTVGAQTAVTGGIMSFTPVPEPATWALMLIGFAGVGAAMRRSRKPVLAQLA